MSTPVGNLVKTKVTSVIESFGSGAEAKLVDSFNTISLSENDLNSGDATVGSKSITFGLLCSDLFESATSELPSITITFDDGMTWGEWLTSDYNTVGFDITYTYPMDDEGNVTWNETSHFELVKALK